VSRLPTIFASIRAAERKALMPFICGGHPRPGDTARLLPAMQRAGASVVEVGYPFSDPVADGPVIAAAMHEALKAGATVRSVNAEILAARDAGCNVGVVSMVSISIVHRVGAKTFVNEAKAAGVDGFIFPDVPLEESAEPLALVREAGLCAAMLIAPATDAARAGALARASSGFVYVLARAGITGEGGGLATDALAKRIAALKRETDLPIAVGFGVSNTEQVRQVVQAGADAAIVGSALVRRISEAAAAGTDAIAAGEAFVAELARGLA
jgi:tryptophan synthase alpha chain